MPNTLGRIERKRFGVEIVLARLGKALFLKDSALPKEMLIHRLQSSTADATLWLLRLP
ncbi:MAG: hypothetical protein ABI947_21795 [Chloroflexota bacterium]